MPDNTIEWGQGAVNNSNDWGGAKANSANSFGAVYDDSPSGDTNIVGGTALSITYSASAYCDGIGDTPQPTVAGNTGAGTFSSTAGLTINSTTGVIDVDASTKGATYVVTYTDTDSDVATANVTLNALDNAGFSYSASSYSQVDADPTPTITGLTGGTFSAGSGLVFVDSGTNTGSSTGEIDLSASTIASYTVTYSTSSSGSSVCPNTSTFSLAVTAAYSPFQMQFEVASGVSKTITIPTTVGSSFTVDWGDGATTTETGGSISHTYNDGTNTDVTNPIVSLGAESDSGPLVRMLFSGGGSASDLLAVTQWGDIAFNYLYGMFQGCNNSNFTISATDTPDFSNATRADYMFYLASNVSGNFNNFTMGTITQFLSLFRGATNFNEDISNWDVSSVVNMASMFQDATNFNQDISSWNTGNVTNLLSAFLRASSFNQNINSWDTSSVTTMTQCFYGCTNFNQNLSDWNISSLTTAVNMFALNTNLSVANYTDTVVGWAVFVYNNSGSPASIQWTGTTPNFDGTRTSDAASGQTYASKYGANWTATGWTDSQDAFDYLTTTLSWTIN